MTLRAQCDGSTCARKGDDERAAVFSSRFAGDESARDEAVEDARQRGSLVGKPLVQLAHRRGAGLRQMGKDMRFALRETALMKERDVQTDPVRRSMDRGNEQKAHGSREVEGRGQARSV